MGVGADRLGSLEHHRVGDDHADSPGSTVPASFCLVHVVERVHHRQQLGRIGRRNGLSNHALAELALLAVNLGILAVHDPFGPGCHLVPEDLGPEQRRGDRAFPVRPVIVPGMARVIFNRVVQEPEPPGAAAS